MPYFKKTISAMLALSMLAIMPSQAFGNIAKAETMSQPSILRELVDQREQNSKTFAMSDGSFQTAIYDGVIHYEKEGKLEDIDNSIHVKKNKSGEMVLQNQKNDFKVQFPQKSDKDENLVQIEKGDQVLSWNLVDRKQTATAKQTFSAINKNVLPSDEQKMFLPTASSVSYADVLSSGSLEYHVVGNSVIQNMTLDEVSQEDTFSFLFQTGNLEATLESSGTSVAFKVPDTNDLAYTLKPPVFRDSAEEPSSAYASRLILEEQEESTSENRLYLITVIPDREWITSEERVLPITLEMTMETSQVKYSLSDMYVRQTIGNTHDSSGLALGFLSPHNRIYFTIVKNTLPSEPETRSSESAWPAIPEGATINDASLRFVLSAQRNYPTSNFIPFDVNAQHPNAHWTRDSSMNWATQPYDRNPTTDQAHLGSTHINYTSALPAGTQMQYDFTGIAKDWYENGRENYGVMLKLADEPEMERWSGSFFNFYSSRGGSSARTQLPRVTLSYTLQGTPPEEPQEPEGHLIDLSNIDPDDLPSGVTFEMNKKLNILTFTSEIEKDATYRLIGETKDTQLVLDTDGKNINFVLDNVSVNLLQKNPTPALIVKDTNVTLTVSEDTQNAFSSKKTNSKTSYPSIVLKNSQLQMTGDGSLELLGGVSYNLSEEE